MQEQGCFVNSSILIVDDEKAIRVILREFLRSLGFEVDTARDGVEALGKLAGGTYDLVLSDINMPRMNGIELLKTVRKEYPDIKRILITSYEVEEYFDLAMEHDIGNIIPKNAPFNLDDVGMVVQHVLTEEFFGLERQLQPGAEIAKEKVRSPGRIEVCAETVVRACEDPAMADKIRMVAVELLTNALFYGARQEDGDKKEEWETEFTLPDSEAIELCWGRDPDKFGLSVADPFGRLKKKDVLFWLSRQSATGEDGLPVGVFDTHGRGLFIARSHVDSLTINIKAGMRTEIVALIYTNKSYQGGKKPLHINEV